MSKKQTPSVDPVVIVMLGVVFVAVAAAMIAFQPDSNSINIATDAGTMSQLLVAFVTGITTGGLSCLAVQGGLLASSLAHQIEQDYVQHAATTKKAKAAPRSNSALPIALFLLAKLVAYTLLGALLCCLGSSLTLRPFTRAFLMIAIGVFIVAWIGQFIGHIWEGKRPSFLTDLVYLLIGPLWTLSKLYKRIGIAV